MKKRIITLLALVLWTSLPLCAQKQILPDSIKYKSAQFVHDWNAKMTDIIMEDGFSPAVISKHHAYANIAAYTAAQPGFANVYRPLNSTIPHCPICHLIMIGDYQPSLHTEQL